MSYVLLLSLIVLGKSYLYITVPCMNVLYIIQSFIVENLGRLLRQCKTLHTIRCTERFISLGYNLKNGITGSEGTDI